MRDWSTICKTRQLPKEIRMRKEISTWLLCETLKIALLRGATSWISCGCLEDGVRTSQTLGASKLTLDNVVDATVHSPNIFVTLA